MRSVKHGKKRSKRLNFNKNLARSKKKAVKRRKEMVGMSCKTVKDSWDKRKTLKQNLTSMGLAFDPNKLFPVPSVVSALAPGETAEMMDIDEAKALGSVSQQKDSQKNVKTKKQKKSVAELLEKEANMKRQPALRVYNFSSNSTESNFYIYLLEKYGDDYEAMSRDTKNIYQHTPKQIERKLKTFKQSSYYRVYVAKRDECKEIHS